MSAKKKRTATALPRVTVLAYNRRDLVAFVQAVETLRLLVQDLRVIAEDLKRGTAKKSRAKAGAAAFAKMVDQVAELGNAATATEAKERAEFDSAALASAPLMKGGVS